MGSAPRPRQSPWGPLNPERGDGRPPSTLPAPAPGPDRCEQRLPRPDARCHGPDGRGRLQPGPRADVNGTRFMDRLPLVVLEGPRGAADREAARLRATGHEV